ncbi:MAG: ABC transporter permease [Lachnospiraceae bacterium]|nr:ABC transporter permease [Lachnospiraceae bacterium]
MKKNMIIVEFRRELKSSRNRFLSIMLIVLLGVTFFAGIRAAGPDMKLSADAYYDDSAMMDIRLLSTLGFTQHEAAMIEDIDGIEKVVPGYTADVFCNTESKQMILHLMSLSDQMNKVTLKEGRLPEQSDECVIDVKMTQNGYSFGIGDTITFSAEEGEITDLLTADTFTIVGIGTSPYYLSLERGSSSIGTGEVSGFVMIPEESFSLEAYTVLNAHVSDVRDLLCYSDEYSDRVDEITELLEEQKDALSAARLASYRAQGEEKIADAEQKLQDVQTELDESYSELNAGEQSLAEGWAEFNQQESNFNQAEAQLKQKEKDLAAGWQKYYSSVDAYQAGYSQWETENKDLPKKEEELKKLKTTLDDAEKKWAQEGEKQLSELKAQIAQIDLQLANPLLTEEERTKLEETKKTAEKAKEELDKKKAELDKQKEEYKKAEELLKNGSTTLQKKKAELDAAYNALVSSYNQLEASEKTLGTAQTELEENRAVLNEAREKMQEKDQELADAKAEYEEKSAKAEEKIAEAQAEIEQARKDMEETEAPDIYILDRNSVESYISYGQDAERIVAIGNVFPVIFFLVAALICLTTMTRMVEENRTQIGTLKALGYSSYTIAAKYLMYAFLATFIGAVIGMIIGQKLLPLVIIRAYRILYNNLPAVVTPIHLKYCLTSLAAAAVCTLLATAAASYKAAASVPAALMRPEAPASGKRILLERCGWLWHRLNFSFKSTFRNLFRYKKRFIMTILGIGGCTGLLLVGFGLRDSIRAIGKLQFSEVCVYDGTLTLDRDRDEQAQRELLNHLEHSDQIEQYLFQHTSSTEISNEGKKKTVYLIVPEDSEQFTDFIHLQDRVTGKTYQLDDKGIVLSEKLATMLNISAGDAVMLKDGDAGYVDVKVSHITENYFYHYIYMTPELYRELFNEEASFDSVFVRINDTSEQAEGSLRDEWMNFDAVIGVSFVTKVAAHIEDILSSLDTITYVLVLAAALLAIVVLYNLNNINICERKRELATLKVLGFYDIEVSMYIFRENIWLTLLGSLFGIGFGILLHRFVVSTAEVDLTMFSRRILPASFGWSICLTILFSVIVNYAMHYKLTKIDMVESLKSTE